MGAPGPAITIDQIAALPAEQIVGIAIHVGNGLIVRAASARYGDEIAARTFSLDKKEIAQIEPLAVEYVKSHGVPKLTPGEMLALVLVMTYGSKIMDAEKHKKAQESRQPKAPPPPKPSTEKPAAATV